MLRDAQTPVSSWGSHGGEGRADMPYLKRSESGEGRLA